MNFDVYAIICMYDVAGKMPPLKDIKAALGKWLASDQDTATAADNGNKSSTKDSETDEISDSGHKRDHSSISKM